MKINYEDYLDEYEEDSFQPIKSRKKFRDSDRASAGNNFYKKDIRKKRQAKQKQREQEEFQNEYEEEEEYY